MFFSNKTAADKLAAALAEYQRDFEKRLAYRPNPDAQEAQARIERANAFINQSGLGKALVALMEHVKYWPSWSKRDDFREWVGFPVGEVFAKEEQKRDTNKPIKEVMVLFVYRDARYGVVYTDEGSISLPNGDYFYSGSLNFIANDDVVLELDINRDSGESPSWRHSGVTALKMGPWSKPLLEIAAHIHAHDVQSEAKRNEEYAINKAKNIQL